MTAWKFKTVAKIPPQRASTFSRLDKPGDAWSSFSKMSRLAKVHFALSGSGSPQGLAQKR